MSDRSAASLDARRPVRGAARPTFPPKSSGDVPAVVYDVLRSPGQPLDPATRAYLEPRFGHDFSRVSVRAPTPQAASVDLVVGPPDDRYEREAERVAERLEAPGAGHQPAGVDFGQVRVHTDARAAESARAVNALAYTVGRDVVFGAGQYAPTTFSGRRLLAHELTHVMQQDQGGKLVVQRQRGLPAGGCAMCTSASAAGSLAHPFAQGLFISEYGREVVAEAPLRNPHDDNGRLDLFRVNRFGPPPLLIEYGEIKPDNDAGVAQGRSDLAWYGEQLSRLFRPPNWLVSRFDSPAPGRTVAFKDNAILRCPIQQLSVRATGSIGGEPGLFLYSCTPPGRPARVSLAPCCTGRNEENDRPEPPVAGDRVERGKGDTQQAEKERPNGHGKRDGERIQDRKPGSPGDRQPQVDQPALRLPRGTIWDLVYGAIAVLGTLAALFSLWGKIGALLGLFARALGLTLGLAAGAAAAATTGPGKPGGPPVVTPVPGTGTSRSGGGSTSDRTGDPRRPSPAKTGTAVEKAAPATPAVKVDVIEGVNAERVLVGEVFPVQFHNAGAKPGEEPNGVAILQVTRVVKAGSATTVEFRSLQERMGGPRGGPQPTSLGGNKTYTLTHPSQVSEPPKPGLVGYVMYPGDQRWFWTYLDNLANKLESAGQKALANEVRQEVQRLRPQVRRTTP